MSNEELLAKAELSSPVLSHHYSKIGVSKTLDGNGLIIDTGGHRVGHIALSFSREGLSQDAPAEVEVIFAERKDELDEDPNLYHGWVSSTWIQREKICLLSEEETISLRRRYAFRYIKVRLVIGNEKWGISLKEIQIDSTTSLDGEAKIVGKDFLERKIDKISIKTLTECAQLELEDGPKRDRRLWLGDLRLEALTLYKCFDDARLVRRCLYLFAGCQDKEGNLPQSVFARPYPHGEEKSMFDYSLIFVITIQEYYKATKDKECLLDLLPVAEAQIKIARGRFKNHLIEDSNELGWCFLDWNLELNRQVGATGVYLMAVKSLMELRKSLKLSISDLESDYLHKSQKAKEEFYDEEKKLFVSGQNKQISYASQIYMVLADVLKKEDGAELLHRLECTEAIKPVTPYLMHYYLEALCHVGLVDKAREVMRRYWGAMAARECDTFDELFDMENPDFSPYGGKIVHSFCHAWSCTPAYFLRTYFKKG